MDAYYIGSLGTMKITLGAELPLMNLRGRSTMTIFVFKLLYYSQPSGS